MEYEIVYDVTNEIYSIKIPENQTGTFIEWIELFKTLTLYRRLN